LKVIDSQKFSEEKAKNRRISKRKAGTEPVTKEKSYEKNTRNTLYGQCLCADITSGSNSQ
jgi:hypothetical protein